MANPEAQHEEEPSEERVHEKSVDNGEETDEQREQYANTRAILGDMESSVYGPKMADAAMSYLDENLHGADRGLYDKVKEKAGDLDAGSVLEIAAEVYLKAHPDALEKYKKGEISNTDLFAATMAELSSRGPLQPYASDIQQKVDELYALNDHDYDRLIAGYQIEELEHLVERAKWVKEQRLRAPKALHEQKKLEASQAFRLTETDWKDVQAKKAQLEMVLMMSGYQSNNVEERKDYQFNEQGELVMLGEPRRPLTTETADVKAQREAAIRKAVKDYNDALAKYREDSKKADAAAGEEEKAYQAVEKVEQQEDANIARLQKKLEEKRAEKQKKK